MELYSYDRRASSVSPTDFINELKKHIDVGDHQVTCSSSIGTSADYSRRYYVAVHYINLPKGSSSDPEKNLMQFWIGDFGKEEGDPSPTGKVKIEQLHSTLPREYKLRAKTGSPDVIAKYLADFLNDLSKKVR